MIALVFGEDALAADSGVTRDTKAPATDLPVKAPSKMSSALLPFEWAGLYFGGHVGYASGSSRWSATEGGASAPGLSGSLDLFNSYDAFKGTGSHFAGLQVG